MKLMEDITGVVCCSSQHDSWHTFIFIQQSLSDSAEGFSCHIMDILGEQESQ